MRAWRLKIITPEGERLSHLQILIRMIVSPIALGAAGIGYFWCLFNKDKLTWQDIASNTRVVETPKIPKKK